MDTGARSRSTLPASILDKSKISLISPSKCWPLFSIAFTWLNWRLVKVPPICRCKISENPRMLFRGVRSSWDIAARNWDFKAEARSNSRFFWRKISWVCARSIAAPNKRQAPNSKSWFGASWSFCTVRDSKVSTPIISPVVAGMGKIPSCPIPGWRKLLTALGCLA